MGQKGEKFWQWRSPPLFPNLSTISFLLRRPVEGKGGHALAQKGTRIIVLLGLVHPAYDSEALYFPSMTTLSCLLFVLSLCTCEQYVVIYTWCLAHCRALFLLFTLDLILWLTVFVQEPLRTPTIDPGTGSNIQLKYHLRDASLQDTVPFL